MTSRLCAASCRCLPNSTRSCSATGRRFLLTRTNLLREKIGAIAKAINDAGSAAAAGARDVSAAQATVEYLGTDWYELASAVIALSTGKRGERTSSLDSYRFGSLDETEGDAPTDFLNPSGMGNFIATFRDGLDIAFNTVVQRILWGAGSGVAGRDDERHARRARRGRDGLDRCARLRRDRF